MFRETITNYQKAKKVKGSKPEKLQLWAFLNRLKKNAKRSNKNEGIIKESFLNFEVYSYGYGILNYLIEEIFLSNEYYFESTIKNPIIIDCGANIGLSVLYFKRLYPDSHILAFEPNPFSFDLLKKNIEVNELKNISIFNIGLYDREEKISFFTDDHPGTLKGSIDKNRGGNKEFQIATEKLSNYLLQYEEIDLVKMDVEGAETNIVTDLFDTSTMVKVKEFIIEYHHNIPGKHSKLSEFLEKFEVNGYNYNMKTTFRKVGFQDILIHFYKN